MVRISRNLSVLSYAEITAISSTPPPQCVCTKWKPPLVGLEIFISRSTFRIFSSMLALTNLWNKGPMTASMAAAGARSVQRPQPPSPPRPVRINLLFHDPPSAHPYLMYAPFYETLRHAYVPHIFVVYTSYEVTEVATTEIATTFKILQTGNSYIRK